jgi:hypothetical protein
VDEKHCPYTLPNEMGKSLEMNIGIAKHQLYLLVGLGHSRISQKKNSSYQTDYTLDLDVLTDYSFYLQKANVFDFNQLCLAVRLI